MTYITITLSALSFIGFALIFLGLFIQIRIWSKDKKLESHKNHETTEEFHYSKEDFTESKSVDKDISDGSISATYFKGKGTRIDMGGSIEMYYLLKNFNSPEIKGWKFIFIGFSIVFLFSFRLLLQSL
ncbi:MAG: hypothetical protein Q9M91_05575 [Candidatus Dojkabacteria bacterium]|nr:hypothetical protein [Candidatus Dojkabacteria bacterium]MDQ7021273.1 hypothetical protein [Candidatus Dojkabacteria bacterium]